MPEQLHVRRSRINSESDVRRSYRMDYLPTESGLVAMCNCPGFENHGECKHIRRLRESMSTALATRPAAAESVHTGDHQGALTVLQPKSLLPSQSDLATIKALANMAPQAKGHLVPVHIDTVGKAAAVMLYGLELGLRPMTALQHVYIVKGKAALSGQAMMGIVLAKVPGARFVKHRSDAEVADWSLFLPGKPELRMQYTIDDANTSGQVAQARGNQSKGTWDLYAPDMLRWNCIKRLCRFGAAHLINSIEGADLGSQIVAAEMLSDPDAYNESGDAPQIASASDIPADAYNPGDVPQDSADGDEGGLAETPPRARFVEAAKAAGYEFATDADAEQTARRLTGTLKGEKLTDHTWRRATDALPDRFANEPNGAHENGALPLSA